MAESILNAWVWVWMAIGVLATGVTTFWVTVSFRQYFASRVRVYDVVNVMFPLKQCVVALCTIKLLKDVTLFILLPVLPKCPVCRAAAYDAPSCLSYTLVAFWVTRAFFCVEAEWSEEDTLLQRVCQKMHKFWSRWYVAFFALIVPISLFLLVLGDLENTKRKVFTEGVNEPMLGFLFILLIIQVFVVVLSFRMITWGELTASADVKQIIRPVLKRLRIVVPFFALNFTAEILLWLIPNSFSHSFHFPFSGSKDELSGEMVAWLVLFNIDNSLALIWAFSAEPDYLVLTRLEGFQRSSSSAKDHSYGYGDTAAASLPILGTPVISSPQRTTMPSEVANNSFAEVGQISPPRE